MLIADLAELLRVRAREVPSITLERVLCESAREFFRSSRAWRLDFSGAVSSTSSAYNLTLPVGALVHDIVYAKLVTDNIKLEYLRDAGKAYITPDAERSKTDPIYITLITNDTFQLLPTPVSADTIDMKVIMTLARAATEIDDAIVEEFEDALIDGALARVYEMPGETWSDEKKAAIHFGRFHQRAAEAKLRAEESRTPGVRKAQFGW